MIDWKYFYDKYYSDNRPLYDLLSVHSGHVADKAIRIADAHPELSLDRDFLYEASMLHDIGIFRTNATGIHCFGELPYICHGIAGAEILRQAGLERHALVCERHTGAGIALNEIIERELPLPHRDMLPVSQEEIVVCFADKFFSKTRPDEEKSVEGAEKSLFKFGQEGIDRFRLWCSLYL